MSDRELFIGYGLSPIDGKGRVAIPTDLRSALEVNSDGRLLFLAQHDCDPCLIGYDRGWSNLLNSEIHGDEGYERSAGRSFERHNTRRRAFSIAERVPFDSSGRFILSGFLKEEALLGDYAFFNGVGDVFEIWNPQTLIETPGVEDRLKRAAAWHMKQRGVG